MKSNIAELHAQSRTGKLPSHEQALALADVDDTWALAAIAAELRDEGFNNVVTYSRKVFIPLTHLCRDVCHYCTFAQVPRKLKAPYMTVDEVLEIARHGAEMGCKEALFTLGEKPELRYKAAREALAEMGFDSTLDYLQHVAQRVFEETGLLPHLNPGTMTPEELARLRTISPSMGIMLESTSERLCEKGMPHYGSPDKVPAVRLETLAHAGEAKVPFTTGILIGIGETRRERIESLLAIRDVHLQGGHVQEVIIQNFHAKPETKMAQAPAKPMMIPPEKAAAVVLRAVARPRVRVSYPRTPALFAWLARMTRERDTAAELCQESFAGFCNARLMVTLEARDFRGMDFPSADQFAKDQAERLAETHVFDAIEENLPDEEDTSEWNWEALAKFGNTRWVWRAVVSETGIANFRRIDVSISNEDDDYEIRTVTGFIGEPQSAPGRAFGIWR